MREEKKVKVPKDFVREYCKKWPRFYVFLVYLLGPTFLFGTGPRKFLSRYYPKHGDKKIINVGSGPVRLREDVLNYDISNYVEVDVVADIANLPLVENSVDSVICDNVLEHVKDPQKAVDELYRILKPGSVSYVSTPFMYPFHASPYDYQRWTKPGLEYLFKDFSDVDVRVRSGIFSSLNVWLCYCLPTFFSFGSDRTYWLLVNISVLVFFPIKFLDILVIKLPFSTHTAAVYYCILRK